VGHTVHHSELAPQTTTSFDKFAKVRSMQTGQELLALGGNTNNVSSVSRVDGKYLAPIGAEFAP
jgi:hypothetical protein